MTRLMIDLTMNLVNRTAVYDIGMELARLAPQASIRHWRFATPQPISFARNRTTSNIGKALGRLVFKDIGGDRGPSWPRYGRTMLFVDPIFSRRTALKKQDIVICHDIAPISNPEYYDPGVGEVYDQAYRRIQAAGPAVVFVSDFTRSRFLERYPSDYRFTRTIPLYFKPDLQNAAPDRLDIREPYFLMVGGLERRKNFSAAIRAFEASGLAEQGYHLYLAGPRGNLSAELLPTLAQSRSVHHLGYVNAAQLSDLYKHSTALFFPSLIEGFGVPAIEATHLGTLAIVSKGTVLAEIVGDDGFLVDPNSIEDMAAGLVRVAGLTAAERQTALDAIGAYQARFSIEAFSSAWSELLMEGREP